MMEIGVAVEIVKEKFYQHWISQSCTDRDLVMLITYACRTAYFVDLVQTLKQKERRSFSFLLLLKTEFQVRLIFISTLLPMRILKRRLLLFHRVSRYIIYWIVFMPVILIEIMKKTWI